MRRTVRVVAVILVLIGLVWTLQGMNVLPGSMMSGDSFWAVMGVLAIVVGLAMGAGSVYFKPSGSSDSQP